MHDQSNEQDATPPGLTSDSAAARGRCVPLYEDKELYNELWANNRGKVEGSEKHLYKNWFESTKTVNLTDIH